MKILTREQSENLYQLSSVINKLHILKAADLNLEFIHVNANRISADKIEVIAKIIKDDLIKDANDRYNILYSKVFGSELQGHPRNSIEVKEDI